MEPCRFLEAQTGQALPRCLSCSGNQGCSVMALPRPFSSCRHGRRRQHYCSVQITRVSSSAAPPTRRTGTSA